MPQIWHDMLNTSQNVNKRPNFIISLTNVVIQPTWDCPPVNKKRICVESQIYLYGFADTLADKMGPFSMGIQ